MTKTMDPLKRLGLGALVLLIAVVVGILFGIRYLRAIETTRWPTVTGTVLQSRMAESLSRSGGMYRPVVRYEYAVQGRSFIGDQIQVMGISGNFNDIEPIVLA